MGKVMSVCTSEAKGTQKKNVGTAEFVEDWGIKGCTRRKMASPGKPPFLR